MFNIDHCYSIDDLAKLSRRKIPRVIFDYIEGGAEDEITLQRNILAFQRFEFIPRVLTDVGSIDLTTKLQGVDSTMPIVCAPTAMSRMFHHRGELAVSRAAAKAGIPYSLSTVATHSIEQIAQASQGAKFFQLYIWKNRDLVDELIMRSNKSGYAGVMLAVDCAGLGKRERDLRNGHGRPIELLLKTAFSALSRPVWLYHFLSSGKMYIANMQHQLPDNGSALKVMDHVNEQFDARVTWEEAGRLRDKCEGAFILKGIQSAADAKRAVALGASGIVLSNHGGRQLDGAPAAMSLLPEVMDAIGDGTEVMIDGGIRRGSDVIKAVAMGARACLIGRPYLYGLSAGGEAGVTRCLDILRDEMTLVMKLIGCDSVAKLNSGYIRPVDIRHIHAELNNS